MGHKSRSISNRKSTISNLRRWWPVIACMALIFCLSAQPKLPPIHLPIHIRIFGFDCLEQADQNDKVKHVIAYAVLGTLIWRALGDKYNKWRRVWLAVAISTAYGMTDEFHQRFVPNRCCDIFDLTADMLGSLIATVTLCIGGTQLGRRKQRRESLRGKR